MLWTLLVVVGSALADDWDLNARSTLSDHIDAEARLGDEGVDIRDASVLAGRVDASGERALSWQELEGRTILSPLKHRDEAEVCARLEGRDRLTGDRELIVYRTASDAQERDAEVVLVSGPEGDQALVSLRPGEQVLSITMADTAGIPSAEYLEVSRAKGRLVMVREGDGALTCYTPLLAAVDE